MRVLVVGGRLQGSEVVYLAKEAGWDVTVVDRDDGVLASKLCDRFLHADAATWDSSKFAGYDLVIPATENLATLQAVSRMCAESDVAFAFDETAFRVSSSKTLTNKFLTQIGVPVPPPVADARDWEHGYIVKPDGASSSHGVRRFESRTEAALFLLDNEDYLGQAFVEGPVYSIEVTCDGKGVYPHVVTEVVVGEDYDCFRIVAPADIPTIDERWIQLVAQRIGIAFGMRGIFDIELVFCEGEPFVLEIDARIPSQTPIAIYHATGLNLVVELARCFSDDVEPAGGSTRPPFGRSVLEHVCFEEAEGGLTTRYVGEAELSDAPAYVRADGFAGADIALVSMDERARRLFATRICASTGAPDSSAGCDFGFDSFDDCVRSFTRRRCT